MNVELLKVVAASELPFFFFGPRDLPLLLALSTKTYQLHFIFHSLFYSSLLFSSLNDNNKGIQLKIQMNNKGRPPQESFFLKK